MLLSILTKLIVFVFPVLAQPVLTEPEIDCAGVLARDLVIRVVDAHKQAVEQNSMAAKAHLTEYESLAASMADELDRRLPSFQSRALLFESQLQKNKEQPIVFQSVGSSGNRIGINYDLRHETRLIEKIIHFNLSNHLRTAVRERRLTYDLMLDAAIEWALLMTAAECESRGETFNLSRREHYFLFQYLVANRNLLHDLFPLFRLHFHMRPVSVESFVGMTARPMTPAQLTPVSILHDGISGERMNPISTLLHDILHATVQLGEVYPWLFDQSPLHYIVSSNMILSSIDEIQFPRLILSPEMFHERNKILERNEQFHRFIFTEYSRLEESKMKAIELIWFLVYFTKDLAIRTTSRTISVEGLGHVILSIFQNDADKFESISGKARSGIYGQRYVDVSVIDLVGGLTALDHLRTRYQVEVLRGLAQ